MSIRPALLLFILWLSAILAPGCYAQQLPEPAPPPHAVLNEQVIRIPGGASPAVTLQTTIMHPDGPGPFPLAIMNHGAEHASFGHRGGRYHLTNAAFYFLSRGYAVALPMMRGFSTSGGEIYHNGCDFAATALADATDIAAVIRYLGNDPRFDTRRVVVAGQSMGGWNTLGVGALAIANVAALVNFNGGLRESDCRPGDEELIGAAGALGARSLVPSLWFYGDNDQLFPSRVWRAMYASYTRHGGRAELVDVGTVFSNSHEFLAYPETQPAWIPRLDAFLAALKLPYADVNPGDLPLALPAASGFADIDDAGAVPYLSDKGRDIYRAFLGRPFPRAVVISSTGSIAATVGGFDPLGRALDRCMRSGARCAAYAVDDRVVWRGLGNVAAERSYALTLPAGKTSVVDFSVRLNPDCTPKDFVSFRMVEPPRHGQVMFAHASGKPHFPAGSRFAVCNQSVTQGMAVEFTPASGFAGADHFAVAEKRPDGSESVLRLAVTVR